ncbi:MAG: hypothetical protein JNM72_07015 [Deltaproteobacteria bacterium]|nr:hypothetical protein [Deltaproteobacteria bacterium]
MDAALAWLRPVLALTVLLVAPGAVGRAQATEEAPVPPPTEQPPAPQGEGPTPPVAPLTPPVDAANAAEAPPGPPPQRLVLLLHGYTSGSGELAGLAELLRGPGPGGAPPLHVHSLDFGAFTRVSHDHNLAVDTLAELLLAAVAALPDRCRVCHAQAEAAVPVAIVARSFGGIIAREAMLRGLASRRAPWHIDRFVTMGTPWMGSTLTRFSTGFQSIVVNGLVRTLLFGFVRPDRGGAFGRVQDAQARAMRVGSPYLWDRAVDWERHLRRRAADGLALPATLHLIGIGAADVEGRGDGVVRLPSAYVAPLAPSAEAETLLTPLRHRELWNHPAGDPRAPALAAAGPLLLRFLDEGSLRGAALDGLVLPLDPPRHPALPAEARPTVFGLSAGAALDPALQEALGGLREIGDLHLRVELEQEGRRQELALPDALSLFVSDPDWSREWPGLVYAADEAAAPGADTLQVAPSPSRQLSVTGVPAGVPWALGVRIGGLGWVPAAALRLESDGDALAPSDRPEHFALRVQQAHLLRLILDAEVLEAAGHSGPVRIEGLRLQPVGGARPRARAPAAALPFPPVGAPAGPRP